MTKREKADLLHGTKAVGDSGKYLMILAERRGTALV